MGLTTPICNINNFVWLKDLSNEVFFAPSQAFVSEFFSTQRNDTPFAMNGVYAHENYKIQDDNDEESIRSVLQSPSFYCYLMFGVIMTIIVTLLAIHSFGLFQLVQTILVVGLVYSNVFLTTVMDDLYNDLCCIHHHAFIQWFLCDGWCCMRVSCDLYDSGSFCFTERSNTIFPSSQ